MKKFIENSFILLLAFTCSTAFPTLPTNRDDTMLDHPIMTYDDYTTCQARIPYQFSLNTNDCSLFYFGSNHSYDPLDKQYLLLEDFWNAFLEKTNGKNCVVLVEGSLRHLYESKTPQEALRRGGAEGGYITFLAQQQGIDIECPEPDATWILQELSKQFSLEHIAYKEFAQTALEGIRKAKARKDFNVQGYLESYVACNQQKFHLSLTDMKEIHIRLFKSEIKYNDEKFFYTITNPVEDTSIINRICRAQSILRDQHIVRYIAMLLKQQKNVFVVFGGTHAIMQENALKNIMLRLP